MPRGHLHHDTAAATTATAPRGKAHSGDHGDKQTHRHHADADIHADANAFHRRHLTTNQHDSTFTNADANEGTKERRIKRTTKRCNDATDSRLYQPATRRSRKPPHQRPTTDDQRPTTDDRRPTTDDRRPTTDDQRPTNHQRTNTHFPRWLGFETLLCYHSQQTQQRRATRNDERRCTAQRCMLRLG